MEAIFYNVSKNLIPMAIFLIFEFLLGVIIYVITRKFDIHKKSIRYCGLLTGLNNRQIIILSAIIIRTFMIIYTVCIYEKNIITYLVMILVIDMIYIVFVPKKILFETINIIAQIIIIYFINVLKTYKIEISDEMYIGQVIITLSVFVIIYSMYFLLKDFEELIAEKKKGKAYEKKKDK